MSAFLIGGLLLLGLGLIAVEVIVIPGTTFVGIVGVLCMIAAVYFTYANYDTMTGHYVLVGSALGTVVLGFMGYRAFASKRFSVNEVMDGKMNTEDLAVVKVGDEGVTVSVLRPAGKAMFNDKKLEVTTLGAFVDEEEPVVVIKVDKSKIFVKPINPD